ncbi:hypothetical protein ACFE04_030997 [Oxalis oulophora]
MADQEFHESDLIMYGDNNSRGIAINDDSHNRDAQHKSRKKISKSSFPVNINNSQAAAKSKFNYMYQEHEEEDQEEGRGRGGEEFEPPHVIVGRRIASQMASFSVCTGNGRTLKGRDLSQVRNSVLRMTGFLEI